MRPVGRAPAGGQGPTSKASVCLVVYDHLPAHGSSQTPRSERHWWQSPVSPSCRQEPSPDATAPQVRVEKLRLKGEPTQDPTESRDGPGVSGSKTCAAGPRPRGTGWNFPGRTGVKP